METRVTLHCDGGSRGNPGPAAIGVVTLGERHGAAIGVATNNVAEYSALIFGLERIRATCGERANDLSVDVFLDSELVARQMQGRYRVKSPDLRPLHARARTLVAEFRSVSFHSVPREENAEADALVNEALDRVVGR
mgnify:CR=1 FL=1